MIGYGVQERSVAVSNGQATTENFQLSRQAAILTEVVTVGYGTQTRGNLTGAVDQIGSQALENRPMANLTQGLQGVLPNVNIRLLDGRPTRRRRSTSAAPRRSDRAGTRSS
jgi:hypothetical protein